MRRESAYLRQMPLVECTALWAGPLDGTGRQLKKDKRGRIPEGFSSILERLNFNAETWLDLVKCFRK